MATYPLKKFRLKGKEFEEVLKKGKSFRVDGLVLKILLKKEGKKIGFLISKKILKKATQRNRLKRRLREILRGKIEEIKEGIRIIFITLPGLEKKEFKELEEILGKLLKKSKTLKNEPNF
jgi:ribonuclease P protein component